MHVITTERQWGEAAVSSSHGEKMCQEVEVVGSIRPHPQTMRDVDLKVSTSFSNKQVRGPALGTWGVGRGDKARLREVEGKEVGNGCADTPG